MCALGFTFDLPYGVSDLSSGVCVCVRFPLECQICQEFQIVWDLNIRSCT